MSKRYRNEPEEPLSFVRIDDDLLDAATVEARQSPRKRTMLRFHEHEEGLQRMLNAIEPESYVRPHRHVDTYKPEAFVALRGSVLAVRFADDGTPLEGVVVSADGPVRGIDVPQGAWHCFIALKRGTVIYEVSQGPYDPATAKRFAPWAPPEEDTEAGIAYIAELRRQFEPILPEVWAVDQIESEEDEIC